MPNAIAGFIQKFQEPRNLSVVPIKLLRSWRTVAILLPIVMIGPAIRWIPITSKYPIGEDSGQYFSLAAGYAQTWPLLPETLGTMGIASAGSQTLPMVSWLMAMLNQLFRLDLFTVVQITPLLICAFGSIALYWLAKEITQRREVGLLAAFFYSTSPFYLWTVYPAYNVRAEFGALFISLFFLFLLKAVKEAKPRGILRIGFSRNVLLSGMSLFTVLTAHEYGILAAFIIFSSFLLMSMSFDRGKFLKASLPKFISAGLLGTVLSVPAFVYSWDFFSERFFIVSSRINTEGAESREELISTFLNGLPSFHYGHLVTLFGVVGLIVILRRLTQKEGRTMGNYLLLSWLVSMYAGSKLYLIGIYVLDPPRMMTYVVIPLSILAGLGLIEVVAWVGRSMGDVKLNFGRKIAPLIIIGLVVVVQVHAAVSLAELTRTVRPAHPYLTEGIEQAMLWLKDNGDSNGITFITVLAPYGSVEYLPGISGIATLHSLHPDVPPSDSLEYSMQTDSHKVITLQDPAASFEILSRYSLLYSEGYVFIGMDDLTWADKYTPVSLDRLKTHYDEIFANREVTIYRAFPLQRDK